MHIYIYTHMLILINIRNIDICILKEIKMVKYMGIVLVILLVGSSQSTSCLGRPLEGHQWMFINKRVLKEIDQKGPVAPSSPSGCSNDPTNRDGVCPSPP